MVRTATMMLQSVLSARNGAAAARDIHLGSEVIKREIARACMHGHLRRRLRWMLPRPCKPCSVVEGREEKEGRGCGCVWKGEAKSAEGGSRRD